MTQLFLTIGRAIYVDLAEISAIESLSDDTCSITVGTFRYGVKRSAFELQEIVSLAKRERFSSPIDALVDESLKEEVDAKPN